MSGFITTDAAVQVHIVLDEDGEESLERPKGERQMDG